MVTKNIFFLVGQCKHSTKSMKERNYIAANIKEKHITLIHLSARCSFRSYERKGVSVENDTVQLRFLKIINLVFTRRLPFTQKNKKEMICHKARILRQIPEHFVNNFRAIFLVCPEILVEKASQSRQNLYKWGDVLTDTGFIRSSALSE